MSYSRNDVRHIVIDSVLRFRLTQQKLLALLQGSKGLESLTLRGTIEEALEIPDVRGLFKKLNRLVLDNFVIGKPHIFKSLLQHASESIQYLHVSGLPQVADNTSIWFPELPDLQYLRLEEHNRPNPLRLFIVLDSFPNLFLKP